MVRENVQNTSHVKRHHHPKRIIDSLTDSEESIKKYFVEKEETVGCHDCKRPEVAHLTR